MPDWAPVNIPGKLIVVTGASSGIGRATAVLLAHAGARVVLVARTPEALEAIALEISNAGGQAFVMPTDIGDAGAVAQLAARVQRELGPPDAIIHSAGAGRWLFLEETPANEVLEMLSAPFLGALWLTRAFLPGMLERGSGRVVFVGSPAAWATWPGATVYAASRWAFRGLYEALRADLVGTGVGATMVIPGRVDSPYFNNNPGVTDRFPKLAELLVPAVPVEAVALAIQRGLEREARVVVLPWIVSVLLVVNALMPRLTEWLVVGSGFRHPKAKGRV